MAHNEVENQALTAVSELSQCKLKISQVCTILYSLVTPPLSLMFVVVQCETQYESLMASLRKTEMYKAQLEERVESLNEELVSLRARGKFSHLIMLSEKHSNKAVSYCKVEQYTDYIVMCSSISTLCFYKHTLTNLKKDTSL